MGDRRRSLTEGIMPNQQHVQPLDDFPQLRMAIIDDIKRHVASLHQSGVDFYGYAVLPPDYYTAFDPTTIAVAFNCESDIDDSNRGQSYYRYSVDEWQNYVHDGFDAVNRELKALLTSSKSSDDDSIDDVFGPSGIIVGDGTIAGERNPQQCKTKSYTNTFLD
jgi:hypothetical protein